jgi:hypothetical protein
MEDPSLDELAGLLLEIFYKQKVPEGTLFMCSSVSHLARVGTTIYSTDWVKMCNKIQSVWNHCTIGPLTPLIRDDCSGTVGRQLIELAAWFSIVYANSIAYPKNAWKKLVTSLSLNDEVGQDHTNTILYTVAMPRSIIDRTLVPYNFHHSSSHSTTHGIDAEATRELLCALLDTLQSDFGSSANSEELVLGEPAGGGVAEPNPSKKPRVIVIGASHCSRMCRELRMRNVDVIDLSVPGWMPTDGNVAKLIDDISILGNIDDCISVVDVLSNVTYRYEQYDGSLALPVKNDGIYHMNGKVQVCSRETVINTFLKTKGIFDSLPGQKIVLPPIPRYLFTPCCDNASHCTETGTPEHVQSPIESTLAIRRHMQDGLLKANINKCTVPDAIQKLVNETSDFGKILAELKNFPLLMEYT